MKSSLKKLLGFFNTKKGVIVVLAMTAIQGVNVLTNIVVPLIGAIWACLIYVVDGVDTQYQPEFDWTSGLIGLVFLLIFSYLLAKKYMVLKKIWSDLLKGFESL